MFARMTDYVTDLIRWWWWEASGLRAAAPPPLGRDAAALLRLSRAGVTIETSDGAVMQASPDQAGARLRSAAGSRRSLRVDLLVEADRHLLRTLSPLRLPRSRHRSMAVLDGAATPFHADECHLVLPRLRPDDPESFYALIRRDQLDPLLQGLGAARIALRRVALATPGGPVAVDGPSRRALGPAPRAERWRRAGLKGAVAVALAGTVALAGAYAWRQERALAALTRQISAAEESAVVVRANLAERQARLTRLAALRQAKSGTLPPIQVLEELARLLPDDTWVDSIEIDPDAVVLSGTSQAAAELIPRLESSPLFTASTFTQPVLRDADAGGERFTIALATETVGG